MRQPIARATSGDPIMFAPSLARQTITLASNLVITKNLTIDGSGFSPQVTISGGNVAHLEIVNSPIVTISGLIVSNGYTRGGGGAIYSDGILTLGNSNTNGFANIVLDLGNVGDMLIGSNWDGLL